MLQDSRIRAAAIDVHEHEPYNVFSGTETRNIYVTLLCCYGATLLRWMITAPCHAGLKLRVSFAVRCLPFNSVI